MRRALVLAERALAADDVPVGAVVLDPAGEVVGEGFNTRERDQDPLGHAELVALRSASSRLGTWRLDDCTLVVTLEPCTMCAGAIVSSRVRRLVLGLWDVVRDRRLNHRPEVTSGVLAEESSTLLRAFFAERR
jgi:tRNA(adenine34) deaminase